MVSKIRTPVRCRPYNVQERGTTVFVVVLVLTLLTGVGLFAARMTTSVDTATGYARQAVQAQGLSLYAGQLAANVLSNQAGVIKNSMEQAAGSSNGAVCPSNRGVTTAYCAYRSHVELADLTAVSGQSLLVAPNLSAPGSLGPKRLSADVNGVEATMQIEFLDVARAIPKSGASMGSNTNTTETPYEFGLNAWAQIRAATNVPSANWCLSDAASTGANIQAARLYIWVPRL
jgi:hypothetical protein